VRRVLFLSFVLVVLLGGAVFWWAEARPRGARRAMNETLRRSETTESERSELDLPDAGSSPGPPHAETRFRNPTTTLPGPPNDIGELRRLRGKVVWDDGKPVPRADVVLRSSPFDGLTRFALKDHGEVRSLTETNYAGEFELEWVEGSFWALTVFAGLENAAVLRVPPATDEITVVLPRRNTVLEVEVVREATGEAIVGAEVKVTWPGSPYTQVEKTAATGIAQFREALAGSARVVVQGTGGERIVDHSVRCRTAEVTRTRIEIGLGLTVRLDVVADESGAPVVCAHVVMGFVQDGGFDIGATDSRGKLVAPALPWDANVRRTLSVVADGFATWQCLIGHPKEDGGEQVVHARLVRNATVRLRCVGADGQPRAGVLVIGTTHRMIHAEGTVAVSTQSGRTDAEGRVSLAELAPGFGGLVACWVKGAIAAELPIAAIMPSEMRDLGDIVVRDPRALTGTVFTASGEPAAGASVVIEPHHATDERFAALASALMAPR